MSSAMRGVAEAALRRPGRVLAAILAIHFVVWTLLPVVFHDNLMRDQIEGYAWGLEWQWGYAKHPPLWAWMLEASAAVIGHPSALAAYAIGAAMGVISIALVWRMALDVATPVGALVAALLLEGIFYFNFRTIDFNANVVLLPFWAAAGWFALRGLRHDRFSDWLGLSLSLAIGLYGKYETGILIAVLAGFFLIDPIARRRLAGWRIWAAGLVGVAVLAPHLIWLWQHEFQPFDYAVDRADQVGWLGHILSPANFLSAQIPECLGFILLLFSLRGRGAPLEVELMGEPTRSERRLIWALAAGPLLLTGLMAAISGRIFIARWAYPMFLLFGVAAVMELRWIAAPALKRFFTMLAMVAGLIILSFALYFGAMPPVMHRSTKAQFPGLALARAVQERWTAAVPSQALDYVVGPIWVAGNLAFYLHEVAPGVRPHVFIDGDPAVAPWIDPIDLSRKGAVLTWLEEGQAPPDFVANFPDAVRLPNVTLPLDDKGRLKPVIVAIAIVPPS